MFIKLILLSSISLFALHCSNRQATSQSKETKKPVAVVDSIKKTPEPDKKEIVKKEPTANNNVSGTVVFVNSYCGGIRPSDEMLQEYRKEYPLTNSTILLKNIDEAKNKSIKITTDSKGNFNAKLNPGTYNLFMTENYSKTMGANFNSSCADWLNQNFGPTLIFDGMNKGYKIIFTFGCNPCDPPRP